MFALALAGCGSKADDGEQIRSVVSDLSGAVAARDFESVCDNFLSDGFRDRLARLGGCPSGAAQVIRAPGTAEKVDVRGDEATVRLSRSGARATLVREGGDWRVDSLTSPR